MPKKIECTREKRGSDYTGEYARSTYHLVSRLFGLPVGTITPILLLNQKDTDKARE